MRSRWPGEVVIPVVELQRPPSPGCDIGSWGLPGGAVSENGRLRQGPQATREAHHANVAYAPSRRRVPVHPEVIRAGFLEYVNACPDGSRLFGDLQPGRHGKLGGPFLTWFARFMDERGLTDPRLTF